MGSTFISARIEWVAACSDVAYNLFFCFSVGVSVEVMDTNDRLRKLVERRAMPQVRNFSAPLTDKYSELYKYNRICGYI